MGCTRQVKEAASEREGRKCGRPPVFPSEYLEKLAVIYPDVKTHRHRVNLAYLARSMKLLKDDPRFKWLIDPERAIRGEPGSFRRGILCELGRIDNEDTVRVIALKICELRPKTKDAVVMIRRWRTRTVPAGDLWQLHDDLVSAINSYVTKYPDTTWQDVLKTLVVVHETVREHEAGSGGTKGSAWR